MNDYFLYVQLPFYLLIFIPLLIIVTALFLTLTFPISIIAWIIDMIILKWLPNKVLKTRTSDDYPKRFYISLIYNFNSRFIEENEMDSIIQTGKDRSALEELINLGLVVRRKKFREEGFYYELIDYFNDEEMLDQLVVDAQKQNMGYRVD